MRYACLLTLAALMLVVSAARPSVAVPQFYTVYKKEFLEKHPDKEYAAAVDKGTAKCLVCHQGKKSRKHHNAFGEHLEELLDRKKDLKDIEKITAMLKKVVAMHIDPKDEKSETYFDRIKASKWPGGELADLEKEPVDDKTAGK
jgi:hypothetical protein